MKRMEWRLFCWLVLSLLFHNITYQVMSLGLSGIPGLGKGSSVSSDRGDNSGGGKGSSESSDPGNNLGVGQGSSESSDRGANSGGGQGSSESADRGDNPGGGKGSSESADRGDNPGGGQGSSESADRGDNPGGGQGSSESADRGDNPGGGQGSSESADSGDNPGGGKGRDCSNRGDNPGGGMGRDCSDRGDNPGGGQGRDCSDRGDNPGGGQGRDCSDRGDNSGGGKGPRDCSNRGDNPGLGKGCNRCNKGRGVSNTRDCMEDVDNILKNGNDSDSIKAIESIEKILEETEVNETTSVSVSRWVAVLHRPKGPFTGLQIYANDNEAMSDKAVTNSKVSVRLPRELNVGPDNTIVFCMLTWPELNETIYGGSGLLYEKRLVGLSVRGKNISGLQERVNITVNLTGHEGKVPKCSFFNFSTKAFSSNGCDTVPKPDQSQVTCSCDHLTYFGVLMSTPPPSVTDQKILSYITLIGCSLSLVSLLITVLLFIRNRKARADISMKVHINLAIALILLNVHFLLNQMVAATSSYGLCLYIAMSLHYSLLASFTWMALEGFHLYLLLVRVFNIYIRKYLLKLSLVGWGIPAIFVSLVVIINSNFYGPVSLNSNSNSTDICYIADTTVKTVTTVGVFGLVFLFNLTMLGVTIRRIVGLRQKQEFGQNDRARAKRDICTLMGVTTLLGITWGLVFFSFGYLNTAGTYLFCILNSLQGVFIFLWFVMSLGKTGNPPTKTSSETRSSKS